MQVKSSGYASIFSYSQVKNDGITASSKNEYSLSSSNNYASDTDKVTFSDAAKALSASANSATTNRTAAQKEFLRQVGSDSKTADELAYSMTHTPSAIMYDISHGDIRLSSTGQSVDETYKENFSKGAVAVDEQLKNLYETEKEKGTDPVQILGKIIDFKNSQSQSYREATYWGYV